MAYAYTPTTCQSRHYNPGNDVCSDCGFPLQFRGSEEDFEALSAEEQLTWQVEYDEAGNPALRSPLGSTIIGTKEVLIGTCGIIAKMDGSWDYDGNGVDGHYDNQRAVTRAGETVFLDSNNVEWLESELVKPGDDLPAVYVSPWNDRSMIAKIIQEKFDEAMQIIMADKQSGDTPVDVEVEIGKMIDGLVNCAEIIRHEN